MTKFVTRFLKDESGATAIEYGLIVALPDAAELPVSLCLSGLKIPGAVIKDAVDISIEIDTATDDQITVKVTPADKGIAVGVVAMFQYAGLSAQAK